MKRLFKTLFFAFGVVSLVSAQTKIVETFDYDVDSELEGQECSEEGWGGPWTVFEGVASDMVIADPSTYDGLTLSGNRLCATLSANAGTRAWRAVDPVWTDDGNDVWISLLMEIENPSAIKDSWQGFGLYSGTTADMLFIGKMWAADNFWLNFGAQQSEVLYTVGQVWLVVKIETNGDATDDQSYMWINPDPTSEPVTDMADVSGTSKLSNGFDHVGCHLGTTAGIKTYYDEIRIGRTWADMLPTSIASPSVGKVSVYNDKANNLITFNCTLNQPATVEIFNIEGQLINTINSQSAGSLQWNTSDVQKGVYMYKLSAGDTKESGKVVVY